MKSSFKDGDVLFATALAVNGVEVVVAAKSKQELALITAALVGRCSPARFRRVVITKCPESATGTGLKHKEGG